MTTSHWEGIFVGLMLGLWLIVLLLVIQYFA
jgi:hypothetical protein